MIGRLDVRLPSPASPGDVDGLPLRLVRYVHGDLVGENPSSYVVRVEAHRHLLRLPRRDRRLRGGAREHLVVVVVHEHLGRENA